MKIFFLLLATLIAYGAGNDCADGKRGGYGNSGMHLAQSEPINGKIYLLPWGKENRRGDWLYNYGLCQSVCAEMVTIHSDKENTAFINFLRTMGIGGPGAWIGGQFGHNSTVHSRDFFWANGEPNDFNKMKPSEPDTHGLSCMNVLTTTIDVDIPVWWSYNCLEAGVFAVCQKSAK